MTAETDDANDRMNRLTLGGDGEVEPVHDSSITKKREILMFIQTATRCLLQADINRVSLMHCLDQLTGIPFLIGKTIK